MGRQMIEIVITMYVISIAGGLIIMAIEQWKI